MILMTVQIDNMNLNIYTHIYKNANTKIKEIFKIFIKN